MSVKLLDSMLLNDPNGTRRDELVAQFQKMHEACVAALREPTSPEDFQTRVALRDACVSAQRIVRIVWRRVGRQSV